MALWNMLDVLEWNNEFFDDIVLDSRLDKETMIMTILQRCGTLQTLYQDTRVFKTFSDNFFKVKEKSISKLIDSTELEYNPIDNYLRSEKVTDNHTGEDTLKAGIIHTDVNKLGYTLTETLDAGIRTDTETKLGSTTTTTTKPDLSTEEQVSAFDASSYQPSKLTKETGTGVSSSTGSGSDTVTANRSGQDVTTSTGSGSDTLTVTRSGSDITQYNSTHVITTENRGNIGVSTFQQMINQERRVVLFNVYEWIAIEYECTFFICCS